MQGEREDVGVTFENLGGAVALVHVQINDRRALNAAFRTQPLNGHCNIVEHAEAGAFGAKCMMRPAGQIASPTGVESVAGCAECPADGCQCALYQGFGPWESDTPDGGFRESAIQKIADVGRVMREFDYLRIGEWSSFEAEAAIAGEQIAQHPVFRHRELVAGGKRDGLMVAIEEAMLHDAMVSFALFRKARERSAFRTHSHYDARLG